VFWVARHLAAHRALSGLRPPLVCEVGFGTGMSSVLLLTATSSPQSARIGGQYKVFDCKKCMGVSTGKGPAENYIQGVFGQRFELIEGPSAQTLRSFASSHPETTCDIISIDGAHTFPQAFLDFQNAWHLAHKFTVVLFDDYSEIEVKQSIDRAVGLGLFTIQELFIGESKVDWVMGSNRGIHSMPRPKQFGWGRFNTSRNPSVPLSVVPLLDQPFLDLYSKPGPGFQ